MVSIERITAALCAASILQFTAGAQLIITEVADATLPGGYPKYVELTNIGGAAIPDLSIYSFGNMNNGGTSLGGGSSTQLNAVSLAAGASYVYAYESATNTSCDPGMTCFEFVYGAPADQYAGGGFINGDDALILFLGNATADGSDAIIADIYGRIGQDGTGNGWDHNDGYSQRCTSVTAGSSVFLDCQWNIFGQNSLEDPGGDDAIELALIQAVTSPFSHDRTCGVEDGLTGLWDCVAPVYCLPKTSSLGCAATLTTSGPTMPQSGAADYTVTANGVQTGSNGIFFVSVSGAWTLPFQGGTLCLLPPTGRTMIQNAGGVGTCDGSMTVTINGGTPVGALGTTGTYMWIQAWYRDSGGVPFDTAFSDAVMVQYQ